MSNQLIPRPIVKINQGAEVMKVFRVIAAVAATGAFAILVQPQTRLATPAPAPQSRPAMGPANVAVIDTGAFSEVNGGITRVVNVMRQIETKFTPLRNELRGMQTRLTTLRADIQKKQSIQDPKMTAQQVDEADRLEVQVKRKAEDAQASYQKESLAALEPLHKDIAGALNAFAQSKGISLLIDINRVPVVYAASNVDITKDFIAEYNRTHPATAAPASAPARP
jgi:outer membrane protein